MAEETSELVVTRTLDAPREVVWRAWTEPEHLTQWWGPSGWTSPECKIDLKVGGQWLNCMRSPEGQDYWNTGIYREIVEPKRFVTTDSFADEEGNLVRGTHYGMGPGFPLEMLLTVTLEEDDGRTKLTMRHDGIPPGEDFTNAEAGWNQSFDKLEAILE